MRSRLPAAGGGPVILPPYLTDPRGDDVLEADYADHRVPSPLGSYLDRHVARPVGDTEHAPSCDVAGTGYARHLFDALEAGEGEKYGPDDQPAPSRYRLHLTCVRCGLIVRQELTRLPDEEMRYYRTERVDPAPLQAGGLVAQQVGPASDSRRRDMSTWTVYRGLDAGGQPRRVGVIAWAVGPRGRAYFVGRLGDRRQWSEEHTAAAPRVESASPLGALRALARHVAAADAYLAARDAELEAWSARIRREQADRVARRDAELAASRARYADRVVELRPREAPS